MKKWFCLLLVFGISSGFAAEHISPIGLWQTIDDHTKQPASVVKLWSHQHKLYGKVVKIYAVNGNKPTDLCWHCPGNLHNKPVQGLTFLWNMQQKSAESWSDGKIMDPKTGSIYRCKMTMDDGGKFLRVRGYIGMPLLGRTQIWRRMV